MPNSPKIKNVQRGLRVDRELDAKVLRKFRVDDSMSVKDAYVLALRFATRKVSLTVEDHERIIQEKRLASAKMHKKMED